MNKKMFVSLDLNSLKHLVVSSETLQQQTGVNVNELELLTGLFVTYSVDRSGKIAYPHSDEKMKFLDPIYSIQLQDSLEKQKIAKSDLLLPFEKIVDVGFFHKFGRINVRLSTDVNTYFMPDFVLNRDSGLPLQLQHHLDGCFLYPEYFKVGESLGNGKVNTAEMKAVKKYHIRYSKSFDGLPEQSNTPSKKNIYIPNSRRSRDELNEFYEYSSTGNNDWVKDIFDDAFDGQKDAWDDYDQ
ncbi:hypothetical protein [Dyadobacter crusticola]|uniref:hypothetical protein n=1 Tax=Dyadobacter crusticola TaxID=292407 RepID=UPI0012F8BB4F|nr:hypothetical protein [Dyadobacter crusticola]